MVEEVVLVEDPPCRRGVALPSAAGPVLVPALVALPGAVATAAPAQAALVEQLFRKYLTHTTTCTVEFFVFISITPPAINLCFTNDSFCLSTSYVIFSHFCEPSTLYAREHHVKV